VSADTVPAPAGGASTLERACTRCGACCIAPDIAALDKPLGRPCMHLGADDLCTIYETRPAVCRSYRADALCDAIDAPTRSERVRRYLAIFDLEAEAERILGCGASSMRAARALPGDAPRSSPGSSPGR